MKAFNLPRGVLHQALAQDVYPAIPDGSVSMVWSDGPYAVGKDHWDRMKPADLPAWYEPHIAEWSRICAPSATVYHWGTSEGEGYVREVYRRHGWAFRGCITWVKPGGLVLKNDPDTLRMWPDVTEVCGFWQRESQQYFFESVRAWLDSCRLNAGVGLAQINTLFGFATTGSGWARDTFTRSDGGWNMITEANYRRLQSEWPGAFDREYCTLREEYESHRTAWESTRTPFNLPTGVTNVWRANAPAGPVRLGHPCHKPLSFVRRAILASSRVGDTILDPFTGSGGVARVCAGLPESERRYHVSIEPEAEYCAAVAEACRETQMGLF